MGRGIVIGGERYCASRFVCKLSSQLMVAPLEPYNTAFSSILIELAVDRIVDKPISSSRYSLLVEKSIHLLQGNSQQHRQSYRQSDKYLIKHSILASTLHALHKPAALLLAVAGRLLLVAIAEATRLLLASALLLVVAIIAALLLLVVAVVAALLLLIVVVTALVAALVVVALAAEVGLELADEVRHVCVLRCISIEFD